jgi:large subunit ribosomal protein L10
MTITLNKKKEIVSGLEKSIKDSNSVVFVKFDKLLVADANSLRRKLQSQDIGYLVSKKTLLKRALDSQKIEGVLPELNGQIGIAYGQDLISPSREIFNFAREHKDNIQIVGGVFEGKYLNASEMISIATIPPLQVLRGMFVNLINSPIQRMAVVLNAIAEKRA